MCISEPLKKYLKDSVTITGNSFYITNLSNVLFFTSNVNEEDLISPVSKELLEHLLDFSNNIMDIDVSYYFANERNKVIPIFEDKYLNIDWNSQIIYPIYIDDRLFGSLIMTSYHKTFTNKHLTMVETTVQFTEKFIIKYMNETKKGVNDIAK